MDLVIGAGVVILLLAAIVIALVIIRGRVRQRDRGDVRAAAGSRDGESGAPTVPGSGLVHAMLKPRGLVEIGGIIEPAWWVGDGVAPGRDEPVRLFRAADGRWLAASPDGRGTAAAMESGGGSELGGESA